MVKQNGFLQCLTYLSDVWPTYTENGGLAATR